LKSLKDTFLIIGCGKAKIWDRHPNLGQVPAKDAYTGGLFRLCRHYAETFYPDRWLILSAKYGLVLPDEPIEKYDVSFKPIKSTKKKTTATLWTLKKQCQLYLAGARNLICIAGEKYSLALESVLHERVQIKYPLAHMGLFARMAWLKTAINSKSVLAG
jgi:cytoplasmic iron level regulating protein YaaA (DUF328/UPF0246 family)